MNYVDCKLLLIVILFLFANFWFANFGFHINSERHNWHFG